jgi:site-specific recombinase XerD
MNIHNALNRFLLQLRANGRSPTTIAQRRRHIVALADWLGADTNVDDVGHEDIAAFLASPAARQRPDGGMRKASTTNVHRTSLREFFGFLHKAGTIPQDPTRLVRRAVCGPPPPRSLSEEEKRRFLAALQEHGSERNRALFQTMLTCGLRVGSAVGLDVGDVDLDRGVLRLRAAKGDRMEEAVVPRTTAEVLRVFIGGRTTGPLFAARGGCRISVRHVQRVFAEIAGTAGIGTTKTHSLRHSFAQNLYQTTADVLLVQRALRHRSIESTLIYARADDRRLREVLGA